jgi:hypothetical protein
MKWFFLFSALPCFSCLAGPASHPATQDTDKLLSMARLIDQQVAAFYRAQKLPVPEVVDDATFLRRSFLVTVGRVPSVEEALPFIEIDSPAKRTMLLQYLLETPGYASHMTNWAFDLLRVTDRATGQTTPMAPYRHWIRQAMLDNMPWDTFAHKLLASTGDGWDPETAAVGYYTRDRGMPLDNLSNTMRIFHGERMECAQCHDDPFGTSERHDFYQLAAFTHGQEPLSRSAMQPIWEEWNDETKRDTEEYQVARLLWNQVFSASLGSGGEGRIPLPQDYQYRDAKPGELVGARTPYGKVTRLSERKEHTDGRKQLADWIIQKSRERFAGVIANRMWERVMGVGLYTPVDEYKKPADTHHPELARLLERMMIELQYDLRAFQHVLLLTRTFQFATNPDDSKMEGGDDFHGRKIARLSAEQVWDSLVTLARGNPDYLPISPLDTRIQLGERSLDLGEKTMPILSKEVLAIRDEAEMREYFDQLLVAARNSGDLERPQEMMKAAPRGAPGGLMRASELPSPAPRDHLLYLFGASDREVVEAASREPNVSQVLSVMNGFVQAHIVNRDDADLYRCLEGVHDEEDQVRRLYLVILNRSPTHEELLWMSDEIRERGRNGIRNVAAALIMSSEFLFLQ